VLDGGEWSASRAGSFTPGETDPDTHWIGGWVGTRAGLDAVVKRKIFSSRQESNPCRTVRNLVATPTELSQSRSDGGGGDDDTG
jgi:hypothetical protein